MYKGENIARAIQGVLQSGLPDALDVVEAEWDDDDPLDLGDVAVWLLGHYPTVLERPKADFPIVACLVPERVQGEGSSQWGYGKAVYTAYVDCFVTAAAEADVNKICWRYVKAIISVAQNHRTLAAGLVQGAFEPDVMLSEAMRQREDNSDAGFFTQMARVILKIEA